MTAGSVPTAITHKRVVPFAIHCSAAKGTEHPAREDIDTQAALQFNDKLLRWHGKPKDDGRSRIEEVPCAGRRLREKLGAIALVARSKIIVEGGNVKAPGQRLLRPHQAVPQGQGIRRRTGIIVDGQRARELSILRGVARVFSHALGSRLRQESTQGPACTSGAPGIELPASALGGEGRGQEGRRPMSLGTA